MVMLDVEDGLIQVARRRADDGFDEWHVLDVPREALEQALGGAFAGLANALSDGEVALVDRDGNERGE